jgi:hypothetical protein
MDWQVLVNFGLAAILACIGWFARILYESVEALKNDINAIKIDLPQNYVRRVDLDARLTRIEGILDKIFDKLEKKADKE